MEARLAHNQKVAGSSPVSANLVADAYATDGLCVELQRPRRKAHISLIALWGNGYQTSVLEDL